MSLIDEVEKLRKLDEASRADIWSIGKRDRIACEMADAAPALLQVLGCFRKGDAKIIGGFLDYIWTIYKQDLASELSEADYAALQNTLCRLQEACRLMEG